jgi:hypothetical protein
MCVPTCQRWLRHYLNGLLCPFCASATPAIPYVIRSWLSGKTLDRDFTFTGDEIMTSHACERSLLRHSQAALGNSRSVAKGCVICGKTESRWLPRAGQSGPRARMLVPVLQLLSPVCKTVHPLLPQYLACHGDIRGARGIPCLRPVLTTVFLIHRVFAHELPKSPAFTARARSGSVLTRFIHIRHFPRCRAQS